MTDRHHMPKGLILTTTTPEFDEHTVPPGLLAAHRVASGVWGRLRVKSGNVVFVLEGDPPVVYDVGTGEHVDIPPATPHRVEPTPGCRFVVEFYAPPQ